MDVRLDHNLRRIRQASGLSQSDVAGRARLSRVAYGSIEAGKAQPRAETLLRIAEALGVRLQDLLEQRRVPRAVRFRALKRMNRREQVLVDVARWLEGYREVEQLLDDRVPALLDALARRLARQGRGIERAKRAAMLAREALGLDPSESIRDICGLLEERAGVKVLPLALASDAFFGLSVAKDDGGPAIVVNVWDRISVERWIFTAAHEVGHLLLHLGAYDVSMAEEDPAEEEEASQFASFFLMPEGVFAEEWAGARGLPLVERVLKVKRIFRVSYRTVLYRLADDAADRQAMWKRFQGAYRARFGRSLLKRDEPEALVPGDFSSAMVEARAAAEPRGLNPEDFVEDRLRGLVRTALEGELISVGRAAEILGLDLRAMRATMAGWTD